MEVEAALHPAAALPPALRRRLPAAALALLGPTALPPLRLRLRRLALRGCVRLSLGPLLPAPPYLAAVALALTQPPLLDAAADLGLGLGSGAEGAVDGRGGEWLPRLQLMALPGVRWAIHAAAQVGPRGFGAGAGACDVGWRATVSFLLQGRCCRANPTRRRPTRPRPNAHPPPVHVCAPRPSCSARCCTRATCCCSSAPQ